jgi:hypothetical protein
VNVSGSDAPVFEIPEALSVPEEIPDPLARAVASRHEDRAGAGGGDAPRRFAAICVGADFDFRERLGFIEVGRDEAGEGKDFAPQHRDGIRREERGSARRAQDGIDDHVSSPVPSEGRRDGGHVRGVGEHPHLDGRGREVGKHGVELTDHEGNGQELDRRDPSAVLGRRRDDDRRAVDPMRREGQEVSLDARAASRVRPGDGDDRGHG